MPFLSIFISVCSAESTHLHKLILWLFVPHPNQCPTTGITKAMVCAILSVRKYIKKDHLLIEKCNGFCVRLSLKVTKWLMSNRWWLLKQYVLVVLLNREIEREMFYLTTHSTHFIYGYMASDIWLRTTDSERGNPLPPHRLLLLINSKGSFICTIPQTW